MFDQNWLSVQFVNYMFTFLDAQPAKHIQRSRVNTTDFKILKVIGRGAFGEVQLVNIT